ncbi:hypothetical protein N5A93_19065 [Roseovarius sp. EGI FJ00037]|uniref:hypothetical protein n=1 Tax=Roseovarius salincola TaxID=2978479 RepID=UPI0022A80DA1|nr:hypothetical protein [Roseovarius sp. EGI FJ00037]MCZ0814324.1 hypothetical protein [Roseovarius sp. EGI FJ00037]
MTKQVLSALALMLVAGLSLRGSAQAQPSDSTGHQHLHRHADVAHMSGGGSAPDIGLMIRPETLQAGERATLTFLLRHPDGEPLDSRLLTHHARKVHVVIVGEDMTTIGHVHPQDFDEPIVEGRATVRFDFPHGGRYLVAADIMTKDGPHSETFIIEVAGAHRPEKPTTPRLSVVEIREGDRYTASISFDDAGFTDGYEISTLGNANVRAGVPVHFSWAVEREGRPVIDLRPFLDSALHLAVVKDDLSRFLHEHGEAAEPSAGSHATSNQASGVGSHAPDDHAHGHDTVPRSFGPDLQATVIFPEPGRYVLFAQAAHKDKMLVLRFPVSVE